MTNNEQYFTLNPQSAHKPKEIKATISGQTLRLITDSGVFSKERLDFGSQTLLEVFMAHHQVDPTDRVLELGSGYGPILIFLAKAFPQAYYKGVELNQRAYELAKENARLNGVDFINWQQADATTFSEANFDLVLTNPPIRAGKATIQSFVEVAYANLRLSGQLWVVIQKKQGAPSMMVHMERIFGNVEKVDQNKGYWILQSIKEQ